MKLIKITAIWCMSCILMNEILKKIESKNEQQYETIEYDFDHDVEEIKPYDSGTILPVYILLDNNGNEIARSVGEKNKKELMKFLVANGGLK